jgi:PKD repeat protein
MRRAFPAVLATLAVAACRGGEPPALDAGADLVVSDAPAPATDKPVSLAVDFAVENCPSFDPVALTCTGKVPLAVRFVPLATTTVTRYRWNFGDGSPEDENAAPSHVYSTPGVYTVRIIATGVGGLVSLAHTDFIVGKANAIGEPCEASEQCNPELFCLCPAAAACIAGAPRGMCTSGCSQGRCAEGQTCAGLRTTALPDEAAEPWQASLCLPRCSADADCRTGLRCRTLPPDPAAGIGWVRGCYSEIPRDVGEPCRDSDGNLRHDLCATGLCVDLGVLGICSMNCDPNACPPGADCLAFGDGRKLCLRPCSGSSAFPCDRDPLLGCIQPTPGDLGYQLPSTNSISTSYASTYCAPTTCTLEKDKDACAPTGTCTFANGGYHCVRR